MALSAPYNLLVEDKAQPGELTELDEEDASLLSPSYTHGPTRDEMRRKLSGWSFFLFACILAIVISALNLSFISGLDVYKTFKKSTAPAKHPNKYHGLENVVYETPVCRNRATFPRTFSVLQAGQGLNKAKQMYDQYDDLNVTFGGKVEAYVEFYVHDFGLDVCTVNAHFRSDGMSATTPHGTVINIYHVHVPGDISSKHLVDTLSFHPDTNMTSRPLPCGLPGQSSTFYLFSCPDERCKIQYEYLGASDRTSSPESVGRENIRLEQYESVDCLPDTP